MTALELATLSSLADEHYAYYDVTSPASFIAALQDLERYIEADGPFDGIVAYSQGAGLVAMLLVHKLNLQPEADCLFKCAILFSPLQVYDPAAYLERWGEVRVLDHLPPDMAALPIPVVIVYGEQDEKKHECIGVQALCNPDLLTVFVHEGGHEVPGIGLKHQILGTVNAARRGVTQAAMAAARC